MIKRIVVGIDGSGPSRAALRWALRRAIATDVDLVLKHVVDDEWGQLGGEYARQETVEGERVLEQALDLSSTSDCRVSVELSHGSPAWTLARDARPDDLLVVGTHKTGFLRGRVLGTRSVVVASAAKCDVVVVPEDNLAHRRGVVVGVARSDKARAAIIAGALEAQRLGQELSMIHTAAEAGEQTGTARAVLAAAAELGRTIAPDVIIHRRVSHRGTTDALLDASRTAVLLVLGDSRTDSDRAGFIGSVTHEVLLNLNSPVMVAR